MAAAQEEYQRSSIGMLELLSFTALGCTLASHFVALFIVIGQESPAHSLLFQAIYLFGMGVSTLIITRVNGSPSLEKWIWKPSTLTGFIVFECVVLIVLRFAVGYLGLSAYCVLVFALGLVAVFCIVFWENRGSQIRLCDPYRFVPIAMSVAGALCVVCRLLFFEQAVYVAVLCLLIACLTAWLTHSKIPSRSSVEKESKGWAGWMRYKNLRVSLLFAAIGIGFGYGWALLVRKTNSGCLCAIGAGVLGVVIILFLLKHTRLNINVALLERLSVACLTVLFVASLIRPDTLIEYLVLILIAAFWFFFRSFNAGLLLRDALSNGFPATQHVAMGKIGVNFGLAVGWILCWLMMVSGWNQTTVTEIVVMVLLIAGFILLPFDTVPELMRPIEAVTSSGSAIIVPVSRIDAIISRYGLSPREGEVLSYLARGRNTRYIASHLFIAENTTKAHMTHIYRKLDVHSQQELIDLFEQYENDAPGA